MRETFIPTDKEFHPFGVWWNQNYLSIIISSLQDYNNQTSRDLWNLKSNRTNISSLTRRREKIMDNSNNQTKRDLWN